MRIDIRFLIVLLLLPGCAGTKNLSRDIAGSYYGYLPCSDCPGIYYELHLDADLTYTEIIRYDGSTSEPKITENRYRFTRDSEIILRKDEKDGMSHFSIKNGTLELLGPAGEKIETGFPERYILTGDKHEHVAEAFTGKGFRASGHEPFWTSEIDFYNTIRFSTPAAEGFDFTAKYIEPETSGHSAPLKFTAKSKDGEFHVTINRKECLDSRSDQRYPYSVYIGARRSHRESFRKFEGCGEYLGNYRLNDIWALEKINDRPVNMPPASKPALLQIDLARRTISGFGGCNNFSGNAELTNNRLVTGQIISTKMACTDTRHIEERFLRTISGKTLDFSIENSTLIMGDGITKLTFSKLP
jgi:heat shock protein HslJ/uncharacterized membrane protein